MGGFISISVLYSNAILWSTLNQREVIYEYDSINDLWKTTSWTVLTFSFCTIVVQDQVVWFSPAIAQFLVYDAGRVETGSYGTFKIDFSVPSIVLITQSNYALSADPSNSSQLLAIDLSQRYLVLCAYDIAQNISTELHPKGPLPIPGLFVPFFATQKYVYFYRGLNIIFCRMLIFRKQRWRYV